MIRTSKRVYPDGQVPADFKNWFKKINNHKKPLFKRKFIRYVESFPFRESVKYTKRPSTIIDSNGNVMVVTKLIRLI